MSVAEPGIGASASVQRLTGRRALYVVCLVGAAVSLVLFIVEIGKVPDLEVGALTEERRGTVSDVTFEVTNNSEELLCPDVRVAARDREASDIAEVVAVPADSVGAIAPSSSLSYSASLDIDHVEYAEEVQEIRAYVYESRTCPAP